MTFDRDFGTARHQLGFLIRYRNKRNIFSSNGCSKSSYYGAAIHQFGFLIAIEMKETYPAPLDIETVDERRENGILIRIVRAVNITET